MSKNLHEVVKIVKLMTEMQVSGIDSAIPFLRGAPGGGKTESIRHMALSNGDEFLSCHFALKQPEDLGGIPQFTKFTHEGNEFLGTEWSIPEILQYLLELSEKAAKNNKKVVFFLDDIHRCGSFHVTALFELLSERKIREIKIPQNVALVLAGNGSIKAGNQLTNSAIINRCAVLDVNTDFDWWKDNFALQNNFNKYIISFLENRQYRSYFHQEEDIDKPWASPRSWTKLSNFINSYTEKNKNIPAHELSYICESHVGEKAAQEFIAYYQIIMKFKIGEFFKELRDKFKENKPKEAVDLVIKRINDEDDELRKYALSHASIIEFLQKSSSERKKLGYVKNICAILIGFQLNPKNPFPEMTISLLKNLRILFKNDVKEFNELRKVYNELAQEVGGKSFTEVIDNFLSNDDNETEVINNLRSNAKESA